jgi:hypothetical protein
MTFISTSSIPTNLTSSTNITSLTLPHRQSSSKSKATENTTNANSPPPSNTAALSSQTITSRLYGKACSTWRWHLSTRPLWREYFKAGVEALKLTGRGQGDRLWEDMKRKLEVLEQRMGEWERNGCRFEMRSEGEGGRERGVKGKSAEDGRVTCESGKDESKPEAMERGFSLHGLVES